MTRPTDLPPSANGHSKASRPLAEYLLTVNVGDKLISTREMAARFEVSSGLVSMMINQFEETGTVQISRRGRVGSFLAGKSIGRLWRIVDSSPLVIALTLPSFRKSEGLATAVFSLLDGAGFETYLTYVRGSLNRLRALRDGRCNGIVVSELAADEMCDEREEVILRLPAQSFVTDHRVFFRKDAPKTGPRTVATDPDSFDVDYITRLEFEGSGAELRPASFMQSDLYLADSSVDAAVSNIDHLARQSGADIDSRPLSARVQQMLGDRDTSAALVIRAESAALKHALTEVLDPDRLLDIQEQVVSGRMVARY